MPGPLLSGDLLNGVSLPLSLQELAERTDAEIDVALGAALIAKDTYPSLDVAALLAELDQMAAPLFRLGLEEQSADDQSRVLAHHVYETLGFRGNEADYYDPKNSLLSDVLDRKLGIPITLAIVYCEIARRVGVPARGVGFPGHFLVRIERSLGSQRGALTVDPFFSGRVLDEDSIARLLRRALGPEETLRPAEHLCPAPAKSILVRILTNLKAIHLTRGEHARAHLALDRILLFTPNAPAVLRERGLLAARLGAHESARADLARAIELDPAAAEEWSLTARLAELNGKSRVLN
jgi:regulator of sirC expression with transglutaminase-like and TPR domain